MKEIKCPYSHDGKHEWKLMCDTYTCYQCGVLRDEAVPMEAILAKREVFEKSNKPEDVRQKRVRDIMQELKELFWAMYELDEMDKDFAFDHIMQFSKLRPRKLTVRVLDDLEFKDFRELIKDVMLERKLTLTAAAEILGIGRVAFTNFMLNKADLSVELALKIQEEFKIDAESMLRMQLRNNLEFIRVRTFRPRI